MLIVDADLRKSVRIEQIKSILRELSGHSERLFVIQKHLHHMVAQAYALGATGVVSRRNEIISKMAEIEVAKKAAHDDANARPELTDIAATFGSMFSTIRNGKPLNLSDAERATSQIIGSIARNGFAAWLDDVRRYHEGTFQHCLLVTGVAVGFAMNIGFANPDVKRLGMAATLHDVGKAHIPISVLDKPGNLDPGEEEIMRRHPVIGYELLKNTPNISREILEGVRNHHEYLDGSGYPDGLMAPAISDLVRLLTISDIFAALIEARSYKAPMPRQDAYKILCAMDGKLEASLVRAFRNVALVA